jgi:hypothetical protein
MKQMADGGWQSSGTPSAICHPPSEGRWENMSPQRKIVLGVATWLVVITAAHMAMNVDWKVLLNERLPENERKLNVAYIPVT